jgi:hypothetical protein
VTHVLAAIVAHSGTASAAELAPAMALIGLCMGATFSTIYDDAIGDSQPARMLMHCRRRA